MAVNLSETHRKILICLMVSILTLAVYWQVNRYDFVNLDDRMYIHENPAVLSGLTMKGVQWAFTSFHASNWHPLAWLSHMLDVEWFGVSAGRMHLVNVLMHVLNTILLFLLLDRATRAPWKSAFVAALFALHPLHVESVAWIAERKDVLSGLFWMLTLGAYILYTENRRPGLYLAAISFFALGLAAKPMLVTIPFVMLLMDLWPLNRLKRAVAAGARQAGVPDKPAKKQKGKKKDPTPEAVPAAIAATKADGSPDRTRLTVLIAEKIPFFVLSAASSLITMYAQQQGGAMVSVERVPMLSRLANAAVSYALYIGKTLWPADLAVFYPYPDSRPLWTLGGALLLLAGITTLVAVCRKRYPFLAMGWFWYLGTLVPVIGIVQVGMQAMADRYTYIPLVGLFVMIAWGAPELLKRRRYGKAVLKSAAVTIIAVLAVLSWMQIGHWRDNLSLFGRALAVTKDNHLAHNNLGVALSTAGDRQKAAFHYAEAIRINPRYANYHYNYANGLAAQGKNGEAIAHYTQAIRLDPDYFNAQHNLGLALAAQKEFREAALRFQTALRIRPGAADVHYNLAVAQVHLGDRKEAESNLREALRLNPDFAQAHNELGMLLALQGRVQDGIAHFREALRIRPDYAAARHNLGLATGSLGRTR